RSARHGSGGGGGRRSHCYGFDRNDASRSPSAALRHWRPRTRSCANPKQDPDARSPNRCETENGAPPHRARQGRASLRRACDRARGRATERAARREAATKSFCPSLIPPPRRSPRRDKEKTTRHGSRAACRTICSSRQREGAVGRARAASWGAFTEIDPKAETVPLESERFVKSVSVIALGVRGQHQLVAALIAAQAKRELHHGFADAVALQRWTYRAVLDDRRR